ncbi:uncharacterized protein B0H18DRAFT_1029385 [Fomitopsis serialis]|uniref:uncharacterized protein n=1 Tax=Fomitopsis serialis TaxID=139415 RepID=UPI0020075937|nr:uncharacterized protein B0H18DRAFT_1029385 [Neoantrodia serialis]KAH9919015.1 hypothetical protein B0H18DRAFT_1029385 [Neoantrodia serialis]
MTALYDDTRRRLCRTTCSVIRSNPRPVVAATLCIRNKHASRVLSIIRTWVAWRHRNHPSLLRLSRHHPMSTHCCYIAWPDIWDSAAIGLLMICPYLLIVDGGAVLSGCWHQSMCVHRTDTLAFILAEHCPDVLLIHQQGVRSSRFQYFITRGSVGH